MNENVQLYVKVPMMIQWTVVKELYTWCADRIPRPWNEKCRKVLSLKWNNIEEFCSNLIKNEELSIHSFHANQKPDTLNYFWTTDSTNCQQIENGIWRNDETRNSLFPSRQTHRTDMFFCLQCLYHESVIRIFDFLIGWCFSFRYFIHSTHHCEFPPCL